TNVTTRTFNRGEEIVKRLVQYIIKHYTKERSVAFYADLLHISPQHLSTTVNKITGKTVTDIIAKLVITDAEAKLKSTDFTIQEIAYSLNFPDISFFGKYFKRYTGMSPKQYRENG
ncbi:AraC family transcriptional regulator, partial [Phocaeicola plebeius]